MTSAEQTSGNWHRAHSWSDLNDKGVVMVRVSGKQIALFRTADGDVRACDNRCPHEGYPLSEGSLSADCWLTCNWHNWKFNLETGENLYGGDRVRVYPVEIREGDVWLDLSEPPFEERYANVARNLRDAFEDHDYDRIAREIARLSKIGSDPVDSLRLAIAWSWQRMEFGWTHAYAGMADWLTLYDEHDGDDELQLVCLVESVAHAAFDVLREPDYPFPETFAEFDVETFLSAIEIEDEATAVAGIRGGLRDGLQFEDFEEALTQAALAHYNAFGHSLIYVTKAASLISRLGSSVTEPLLLSLVRQIVMARREDKIPEFRGYASALSTWGEGVDGAPVTPKAALWRRQGIDKALNTTVSCRTADPEVLYRELMLANAVNLLSFDLTTQDKVHVSVSANVGWLDLTHGMTFANAVRKQCQRFPDLWPRGLLQMACFAGRNASFTTPDYALEEWRVDDRDELFEKLIGKVFDHGLAEYIASVHWLKTTMAIREEVERLSTESADVVLAALNRFINSPMRRRQVRRTAYQSLAFVARE